MTAKYATESCVLEFRDLQATTMSLDDSGMFALLAGRKYLGILDLTSPSGDLLVRIPYGGKYEISCTQWSSLSNANVVAVASSQRCDIFELTDSAELKCLYRLKCHSRVITDIDWSSLQPYLLATSSFDSYVHIWDIRLPRQTSSEKPQLSLSALDGASQVRWNKVKAETLASCDGGHVKIWDMRKTNAPAEYIAAHASRINGLEWLTGDTIVTAAQDCTVKLSKLAASLNGKSKGPYLTLPTPVWRARPAPFGRGLVTQCVPILRRDAGLLSLWDWERFSAPVLLFQANDIVEFSWKRAITCDLITWSRDQTLRVWSLSPDIVETCGENPWNSSRRPSASIPVDADDELPVIDVNDDDDAFEENGIRPKGGGEGDGFEDAKNGIDRTKLKKGPLLGAKRDEAMKREFDYAESAKSEHINFDQVDLNRGLIKFSWKSEPNGRVVSAFGMVSFPVNYPAAPLTFLLTTSSQDVDKVLVMKQIRQTAHSLARKKELSLKPCLEQFAAYMNLVKPSPALDDFSAFPSRGVSNVPFPRTSGARFCSVGILVVFGRPSYLRRVKSNTDTGTPRSLSLLGPFLSQLAHDNETLKKKGRRGERKRAGLVTVFDMCSLLPFSKSLASELHYLAKPGERKSICLENERKALSLNCTAVSFAWKAAAIVASYAFTKNFKKPIEVEVQEDDEDINWINYHPLGRTLVNNVIQHYASHGDVQTAASVASLFTNTEEVRHSRNPSDVGGINCSISEYNARGDSNQNGKSLHLKQPRLTVPKWWTKGIGSPYHTVHGSDTQHGVAAPTISEGFFRQHRSNSWSDSLDDASKSNQVVYEKGHSEVGVAYCALTGPDNLAGPQGRSSSTMLDPSLTRVYDSYKRSYAEILYRWGQLQQRSEVLKSMVEGADPTLMVRQGLEFVNTCSNCQEQFRSPFCPRCKKLSTRCCLCHLPVKGVSAFCSNCGHGGHASHVQRWFTRKKECPSGCGCLCLEMSDL